MLESINTENLPAGGEFDFYGRRYAVYDQNIKIYSVTNDEAHEVGLISFIGQKANCLSWCHPSHGGFIAAGCDNRIYIWKEAALNSWELIYTYSDHLGKINSIAWSPYQVGLNLLVGSDDQYFSIISNIYENNWHQIKRKGHNSSIFSVSWINHNDKRTFVTAAEKVKIWKWVNGEFEVEFSIEEAYNDVKACFYNLFIAACGKEGVFIWKKDDKGWVKTQVLDSPSFMVQWSSYGNILLATSEHCLSVIRQAPNMAWIVVQTIDQNGKLNF